MDKEGDKSFPDSPCDKTLLLNSLKKYQKDGAILGVEKVINPKEKNYGDARKALISVVFTIVGSMPKCILYELDDNGKRIKYEDEMTGEEKYKMKVEDGNLKEVIYPFYANISEGELDDNTTLVITPKTSSYSFFREGLIDGGALPEDAPMQSIATNFAEIKESLEGFTFRGKYELIKGKYRSFPSLLCERVEEEL